MEKVSSSETIAERYHVLHSLGRGGMGAVYLAQDTRFAGRHVALKENLDRSPAAQQQFRLEAEVLATLYHPHLPAVTDHFILPDGRQFLVMNYVDGETLREYVDRHGAVPEAKVLSWASQIASALAYLHAQSPPIIHRDVKPTNIRITPQGNAVLVDFGVVKKLVPGQATVTIAKAGSPGYAPLEQYTGGTDQRSDVYSLGATLYFALTGTAPPESPQVAGGQVKLLPPRRLRKGVSASIDRVVMRAMAVHAEQRYARITDFQAALQAASRGEKVNRQSTGGAVTSLLAMSAKQKAVVGGVLFALIVMVISIVWVTSTQNHRPPARLVAPHSVTPIVLGQAPSRDGDTTPLALATPFDDPATTTTRRPAAATLTSRQATSTPRATPPPVGTITLLSPGNGAQGVKNPVYFKWQAITNAEKYQVLAQHSESGASIDETVDTPSYRLDIPADKYGEWRWTVRAILNGKVIAQGSAMFGFDPGTGGNTRTMGTIAILSPGDGAQGLRSPVDLAWQKIMNASYYQILATHVESGYQVDETVTTNAYRFNIPMEKFGEWRWTVRAIQDGYVIAQNSARFGFDPGIRGWGK